MKEFLDEIKTHPFYGEWIKQDPLPIMDRTTFLKNNDLILNGNEPNARTSGSTGIPVRVYQPPITVKSVQYDIKKFKSQYGKIIPSTNIIYINGYANRRTIDLKTPIKEQISFIQKLKNKAITTYPTNAEMLAKYVIENNIDFSYIKQFGLFAECVEPFHLEILKQAFPNAIIWSTYSSMEVGLIAHSCPKDDRFHHIMNHRLGIEILDDNYNEVEEGEVGRIIITDYLNKECPIIRYEIGDYGSRGICPCGKESFTKIYGKIRGALVNRSGERKVFTDLSVSLRDIEGMHRYQVIQNDIENFIIKVITDKDVDEKVINAFTSYFGYTPDNLKIEYVKDIPLGENRKFYASICKI